MVDHVVTLRITNHQPESITFRLEPWGDEYPMPSGATFEVIVTGPTDAPIEVELAVVDATVWAWPGSTARVFHGMQELGAGGWERDRVPRLPKS